MEALLEGSKVSSEHSSASMAPKRLPKGSPQGLQGVPPGASGRAWVPNGSVKGSLWESAKTNSEEGSARAFIFMVSLHIGIHLLETEYVR